MYCFPWEFGAETFKVFMVQRGFLCLIASLRISIQYTCARFCDRPSRSDSRGLPRPQSKRSVGKPIQLYNSCFSCRSPTVNIKIKNYCTKDPTPFVGCSSTKETNSQPFAISPTKLHHRDEWAMPGNFTVENNPQIPSFFTVLSLSLSSDKILNSVNAFRIDVSLHCIPT